MTESIVEEPGITEVDVADPPDRPELDEVEPAVTEFDVVDAETTERMEAELDANELETVELGVMLNVATID